MAWRGRASQRRVTRLAKSASQGASGAPVGGSNAFTTILHQINRVAPTRATVLLLGESGVGKSLFARELHDRSRRKAQAFVAVNCAAIPNDLLESELFGAERGAYTGAHVSRGGRFELAEGGTLFLDEIATLSLTAQGKLLRVLQTGEYERLGSTRTRRADVRVIAATNADLEKSIRDGSFRQDWSGRSGHENRCSKYQSDRPEVPSPSSTTDLRTFDPERLASRLSRTDRNAKRTQRFQTDTVARHTSIFRHCPLAEKFGSAVRAA